jgi:DNA (cytosine-5)-methyltransferase 1
MTISELRFIDLFCGIGGFRIAAEQVCSEQNLKPLCVFSSDIDLDAQKVYKANFCEKPYGDVTQINEQDIPDHDILFAGFPCQAFSICGEGRGFEDTRGTLFFDIARILKAKRPRAFVLENVKQLETHDGGRTLHRIMETLQEIGYDADYRILNALDFGLPQKRERIFIVGFLEPCYFDWKFERQAMKPLEEVLEKNVSSSYFASEQIRQNRKQSVQGKEPKEDLTIWHENKGGNISPLPFSCALRAGASYNYLLVNGERRLTEREMLRLQGFPDSFKIDCSYQATRKLTGNSVAVPCVKAVINLVINALETTVIEKSSVKNMRYAVQESLFAQT